MINLIKNELIKIFRKKGTYIFLIIFILFIILTNFLYKFLGTQFLTMESYLDENYIEFAKTEIQNIDINTDRSYYIELKTDIDFYDLYKKYDANSWQAYILQRDFRGYIYNLNTYKYGTEMDKAEFTENPEEVLNAELKKLDNNDWKQYVHDEITDLEAQIALLKEQIKAEGSTEILNNELHFLEVKLEMANTRLKQDIPYNNNYLNDAIGIRIDMCNINYDYDKPNISYKEKINTQASIKQLETAKYVLDTKQDVTNTDTLRGVLLNLFSEYSIFIVIFVIMIAGGIVSSELEKGTIKMLLVKPYTRTKILISKYIVSMMMIVFIFLFTIILQTIIGGIILGFDSLSIPVVEYNFNTNSLETFNIFHYVFITMINVLPSYILLTTLAFAISCLFGNTVISIVLPIIFNIGSAIINTLATAYSIKQLIPFPTLHWDFNQFLFGKLPSYEYTNLGLAAAICTIYLVILLTISWFAFKKREIKNV